MKANKDGHPHQDPRVEEHSEVLRKREVHAVGAGAMRRIRDKNVLQPGFELLGGLHDERRRPPLLEAARPHYGSSDGASDPVRHPAGLGPAQDGTSVAAAVAARPPGARRRATGDAAGAARGLRLGLGLRRLALAARGRHRGVGRIGEQRGVRWENWPRLCKVGREDGGRVTQCACRQCPVTLSPLAIA